jgi:hypothetical protein
MSAARWERLKASLAAAGVDATVDERPYSEAVYGRVQHGVSRSIAIRTPDRGFVEIGDGWWRKNPDVWIGWKVVVSGADSIITRDYAPTKKRSEVVAAVKEALA